MKMLGVDAFALSMAENTAGSWSLSETCAARLFLNGDEFVLLPKHHELILSDGQLQGFAAVQAAIIPLLCGLRSMLSSAASVISRQRSVSVGTPTLSRVSSKVSGTPESVHDCRSTSWKKDAALHQRESRPYISPVQLSQFNYGGCVLKPAHVSCARPARRGLRLSSFFFLHRAALTLLAILLHFILFTKAGVCVKPLTWQQAVHLIDLLVESSPFSALLPLSKLCQLDAATNHMLWEFFHQGCLSSGHFCCVGDGFDFYFFLV